MPYDTAGKPKDGQAVTARGEKNGSPNGGARAYLTDKASRIGGSFVSAAKNAYYMKERGDIVKAGSKSNSTMDQKIRAQVVRDRTSYQD
jgi:hypothetical protein